MYKRFNPDEKAQRLRREAELGGPVETQRYYIHIYRSGEFEKLVEKQITEGVVGSEALWYWKRRFQDGFDVIFLER